MSIPYDPTIPQAGDYISDSQSDIQSNFTSIDTIWSRDHYQFASANAGQHQFMRLPAPVTPPAAALGSTLSSIFSKVGLASATEAVVYANTGAGDFPLSLVRAFGYFEIATDGAAPSNVIALNCAIARSGTSRGIFNVTFSGSQVPNTQYGVLYGLGLCNAYAPDGISATDPSIAVSTLRTTGGFTIRAYDPYASGGTPGIKDADPVYVCFIVIQV